MTDRDAIYLYAFVGPGGAGADGLDLLEGVEGGGGVALLDCGGLGAVVSRVPRDDYERSLGGPDPADPAWVIPRAVRHEHVVEAVAGGAAALPARFGTLFSTPEAVRALASRHRHRIGAFLDSVEGKDEWSFRVEYETEAAVDSVLRTDPAFAGRFAALPASPGARYFREKSLRAEAGPPAARAASAAASAVRGWLEARAECRVVPCRRPEAPGRSGLLHVAALLPRARAGGLIEAARGAAAGPLPVDVVVTGPWPPFHFCPDLGPG